MKALSSQYEPKFNNIRFCKLSKRSILISGLITQNSNLVNNIDKYFCGLGVINVTSLMEKRFRPSLSFSFNKQRVIGSSSTLSVASAVE